MIITSLYQFGKSKQSNWVVQSVSFFFLFLFSFYSLSQNTRPGVEMHPNCTSTNQSTNTDGVKVLQAFTIKLRKKKKNEQDTSIKKHSTQISGASIIYSMSHRGFFFIFFLVPNLKVHCAMQRVFCLIWWETTLVYCVQRISMYNLCAHIFFSLNKGKQQLYFGRCVLIYLFFFKAREGYKGVRGQAVNG